MVFFDVVAWEGLIAAFAVLSKFDLTFATNCCDDFSLNLLELELELVSIQTL